MLAQLTNLLHGCHFDEVSHLAQEGIDLIWGFLAWEND
jgi:hypothetical protein